MPKDKDCEGCSGKGKAARHSASLANGEAADRLGSLTVGDPLGAWSPVTGIQLRELKPEAHSSQPTAISQSASAKAASHGITNTVLESQPLRTQVGFGRSESIRPPTNDLPPPWGVGGMEFNDAAASLPVSAMPPWFEDSRHLLRSAQDDESDDDGDTDARKSWEEPDAHEVKPPKWLPEGWTDDVEPWRKDNWRWGPSDLIRWKLLRRFLVHDVPPEHWRRGFGASSYPEDSGAEDEKEIRDRHGANYDIFWWRSVPTSYGGDISDADRKKEHRARALATGEDCVRGPFEFWCASTASAKLRYRVPMIFEVSEDATAEQVAALRRSAEESAKAALWKSLGESPYEEELDEHGQLQVKDWTDSLKDAFCQKTIDFYERAGILPSEAAKEVRAVLWGDVCDDYEGPPGRYCFPDCIRHGKILKLQIDNLRCSDVAIESEVGHVALPGPEGKWTMQRYVASYITYTLAWDFEVLYQWWCVKA